MRARAGFSLIEILVVITIIGLLMTLGVSAVQSARETSRVTTCQDHLRQLGQSMLVYKDHRNKGRWPNETGIRFLLTLYRSGEISPNNSNVFLCPGTQDRNDTGVSGEPGSSYDDWDAIDSATISYAGRDTDAYPIRGSDYSSILIASDDNEFGPNHKNATNYLYADGSVRSFDLGSEEGLEFVEEYPDVRDYGLVPGPDCPLEKLQVLRVD